MPVITEVAPDGLRYIATASGKTYRSLNYHRSAGGRDKSIWTIPRPEEFEVFSTADDRSWYDDQGYWSFLERARVRLGERGERLAFFPTKVDSADDWHGYPLSLTPVRRPQPSLADSWVRADAISFAVGEKIKRGKL